MSAAPEPPPTAPKPAAKPGEWKTLPKPNEYRRYVDGIAFNGHQFLVIGGPSVQSSKTCEYYDTKTGQWHEFPGFPYEFEFGGIAKRGDRVFVLGDVYGNQTGFFSIHVPGADLSSAAEGTWTPLAKMKKTIYAYACEYDSKYIYVFGGVYVVGGEPLYLDSAERYDILKDKWESLPPMPGGPRSSCAACRVGDKIYIVGGQDEYENRPLASTIVFDTARGEWESTDEDPVPDMNTARFDCAVVVVDQFVIAIGGSQNKERRLSSIEVLDTQDNVWAYAPTSMTRDSDRVVGFLKDIAGFLKDTKEIIVVHNKSAESIHLESVHKPRSTLRGQKMIGDHARGEDKLNLRTIAVAIANSLLFKDLKPPFVVGILGKWGRGKSFFFNMIEEQIIRIQRLPADEPYKDTYAGHIYVIEFSAWEFSEGDIWSSLMYKILKDLNMQLQFEHEFLKYSNDQKRSELENLRKKINELEIQIGSLQDGLNRFIIGKLKKYLGLDKGIRKKIDNLRQEQNTTFRQLDELRDQETPADMLTTGKISTVEMFRKLSDGDIQKLRNNRDGVWTAFQEIWKNGDQASETLLQAINFNYQKDLDELKVLEASIKIQETKDQTQHVLKFFSQRTYIEKFFQVSITKYENDVKACEEALKALTSETNGEEKKEKEAELRKAKEKLDGIKSVDSLIDDIHFFRKLGPSLISIFSWTCIVVTTLAAIFLSIWLPADPLKQVAYWMPTLLSIVTGIAPTSKKIRDITEELLKEEMTPSKDMQDLLNRKNEIRDRAVSLKGRSLKQTMEEIDVGEYENNLSIIYRVHMHLKLMSESMTNQQRPEQFPRGSPRIVLFVDDLDRCHQKTVVRVLEAIQLLVSHELFTAIVAIDPRYVTKSIEKEYNGVLHNQRAPTGMDYLEKFIQIPFRLPDVAQDKLRGFIDSQMIDPESVESVAQNQNQPQMGSQSSYRADSQPGFQPDLQTDPESSPQVDSQTGLQVDSQQPDIQTDVESGPQTVSQTTTTNPVEAGSVYGDTAIQRNKIPFTLDERDMMQRVLQPFGVDPRCMKRIINVFKLLKVIWEKDSSYDERNKEDILFMMLLASDRTTRHVTFNIFDWMESGSVKFHRVMQDDQGEWKDKNDLASVFRKELKRQDETMVKYCKDGKSKEDSLMRHIETYLSEYEWENMDDWKEVSSRFLLARCFSFFCLVPSAKDSSESDNYSEQMQNPK